MMRQTFDGHFGLLKVLSGRQEVSMHWKIFPPLSLSDWFRLFPSIRLFMKLLWDLGSLLPKASPNWSFASVKWAQVHLPRRVPEEPLPEKGLQIAAAFPFSFSEVYKKSSRASPHRGAHRLGLPPRSPSHEADPLHGARPLPASPPRSTDSRTEQSLHTGGERKEGPHSPQRGQEGIVAGPKPTLSSQPLDGPPNPPNIPASATGRAEEPGAAAAFSNPREAPYVHLGNFTGPHRAPRPPSTGGENLRFPALLRLRAARCAEEAGLRGASWRSCRLPATFNRAAPANGKERGDAVRKSTADGSRRGGAWAPGRGWRPGASFPRLRARGGRTPPKLWGPLTVALLGSPKLGWGPSSGARTAPMAPGEVGLGS